MYDFFKDPFHRHSHANVCQKTWRLECNLTYFLLVTCKENVHENLKQIWQLYIVKFAILYLITSISLNLCSYEAQHWLQIGLLTTLYVRMIEKNCEAYMYFLNFFLCANHHILEMQSNLTLISLTFSADKI